MLSGTYVRLVLSSTYARLVLSGTYMSGWFFRERIYVRLALSGTYMCPVGAFGIYEALTWDPGKGFGASRQTKSHAAARVGQTLVVDRVG